MSEPAELAGRVTRLEHEMAEVRFLATKAEREASDCRTILHGHTGVLNAIREDQVDQGRKIAKIETRLGGVETRLGGVETRLDSVEGEMRAGYTMLARGQERITELLTRHIDECEKG